MTGGQEAERRQHATETAALQSAGDGDVRPAAGPPAAVGGASNFASMSALQKIAYVGSFGYLKPSGAAKGTVIHQPPHSGGPRPDGGATNPSAARLTETTQQLAALSTVGDPGKRPPRSAPGAASSSPDVTAQQPNDPHFRCGSCDSSFPAALYSVEAFERHLEGCRRGAYPLGVPHLEPVAAPRELQVAVSGVAPSQLRGGLAVGVREQALQLLFFLQSVWYSGLGVEAWNRAVTAASEFISTVPTGVWPPALRPGGRGVPTEAEVNGLVMFLSGVCVGPLHATPALSDRAAGGAGHARGQSPTRGAAPCFDVELPLQTDGRLGVHLVQNCKGTLYTSAGPGGVAGAVSYSMQSRFSREHLLLHYMTRTLDGRAVSDPATRREISERVSPPLLYLWSDTALAKIRKAVLDVSITNVLDFALSKSGINGVTSGYECLVNSLRQAYGDGHPLAACLARVTASTNKWLTGALVRLESSASAAGVPDPTSAACAEVLQRIHSAFLRWRVSVLERLEAWYDAWVESTVGDTVVSFLVPPPVISDDLDHRPLSALLRESLQRDAPVWSNGSAAASYKKGLRQDSAGLGVAVVGGGAMTSNNDSRLTNRVEVSQAAMPAELPAVLLAPPKRIGPYLEANPSLRQYVYKGKAMCWVGATIGCSRAGCHFSHPILVGKWYGQAAGGSADDRAAFLKESVKK